MGSLVPRVEHVQQDGRRAPAPGTGGAARSPAWKYNAVRFLLAVVLLYFAPGAVTELELRRLLASPAVPVAEEASALKYDGINFASARDLKIYIAEGRRNAFFPWTKPLDEWHALLIVCIVSGSFGGLVRDIRYQMRTTRGVPKRWHMLGARSWDRP